MHGRTFDDFDDYAENYRALHTENVKISGADSFYFAEMKVRLLQQFEVNESLRILDLGCGDGTTEWFIQKHFANWKISGIDVSDKSIVQARQKDIANASFEIYDGNIIPFEAALFDIVFVAGVLHHVDASLHQKMINEAARVLKKNGRLYIFEHNPLNPLTRYLVRTCVFDKQAKLLSSARLGRLLRRAGLAICTRQFIIFFPRKGLFTRLLVLEKWMKRIPFGGQYFFRAVKN